MDFKFAGEKFTILPQPFLDLMADNPFTGDLYVHSMGHVSNSPCYNVSGEQGDSCCIFIFCYQGCGKIKINEKEYDLKTNQYIIIPERISYQYSSSKTEPWTIYWLRFMGPKSAFFSKQMNIPQTLPSIHSLREKQIELFESMFSTLMTDFTLEKLNYTNSLLMHYLSLFLYCNLYNDTLLNPSHTKGVINHVTQFMKENIERTLTIQELAQYTGYSESYFYRKFIKETGFSPIDYFIHMKINKAAVYLIKTKMTSVEISNKLGFSNPDYFSRTFKKVVGITVTEFRKEGFRL